MYSSSPVIFVSCPWAHSRTSVSLLSWGEQNWTRSSRCNLTSTKERWGTASFNSYACQYSPRCRWLSLLQWCAIYTFDFFIRNAGLYIYLCWPTWGFWQLIFPACYKVHLNISPALHSMDHVHPSLLSCVTLQGVHAIPSCRTLIEMLNLANLWINAWGVPLIISHQLAFMSGIRWWVRR